jgi:hypothetical protein
VAVLDDTVFATELFSGQLNAFDARTGAPRRAFRAAFARPVAALVAARHRLYAGMSPAPVRLDQPIPAVVRLDPDSGRIDPGFESGLKAIEPRQGTRGLALTLDALYVSGDFAPSGGHGRATLALDPQTGRRRSGFGAAITASALAVDGHSVHAATANADGSYRLVKLPRSNGKPTTVLRGIDGRVCAVANASGRLYVGGAFDSIAGHPTPSFAGLSLRAFR